MTRCSICDRSCRFVAGDGPTPADFLFIGEKPGREEDSRGRPFVGDTGQEFNSTYLPLAGLSRDEVRVTNTVKCRLGGNNNKPSEAQIRACAGFWLPQEVQRSSPAVIVLMGATACSLIPSIELDKDHGIPVWGASSYFGGSWEGWIVPMYHPAAALHDTAMMIPLLDDFDRLRKWRNGSWQAPTSSQGRPRYLPVSDRLDLVRALEGNVYEFLPVDTENDGPRPWSLQFSPRPNEAYLIRAERKELLAVFRDSMPETLVLHNAVHDLDVLAAMGIEPAHYRDTMQEAYHLGNLPRGLKALGWRLLGIRMRSWEDVVLPHSRDVMLDWLNERWNEASEDRERVEIQLKTKVKILYKPRQIERDLKRILSHAAKSTYDVWAKTAEVIAGAPVPSIAHVPFEQALAYACQDADVTGQVAAWLERERDRLASSEWLVAEEDWDR